MDHQTRECLRALYKRLLTSRNLGVIAGESFSVGVAVLARMVTSKSMECTLTWRDLLEEVVTLDGNQIAQSVSSCRWAFYGALVELHEQVGLLSHISRACLDEAQPVSFIREPSESGDSHVVGPSTILLFRFHPPGGYDVTGFRVQDGFKPISLPRWVTK